MLSLRMAAGFSLFRLIPFRRCKKSAAFHIYSIVPNEWRSTGGSRWLRRIRLRSRVRRVGLGSKKRPTIFGPAWNCPARPRLTGAGHAQPELQFPSASSPNRSAYALARGYRARAAATKPQSCAEGFPAGGAGNRPPRRSVRDGRGASKPQAPAAQGAQGIPRYAA